MFQTFTKFMNKDGEGKTGEESKGESKMESSSTPITSKRKNPGNKYEY